MGSSSDYLVFGSPKITEDDIAEVVATLRSAWIGTGPRVRAFEQEFAKYVGSKFAVAVGSCTAALHLSILASGIGPGDEVITTPMTFCATANAIVHAGAKPVFCDVDSVSGNITAASMGSAVTSRTKGLIPVHLAGFPCDMDPITELAQSKGFFVVEDAAHCIEGRYRGRKVGSISKMTCFSFYVTKNLVTGEGGMVTTDDSAVAEQIKINALHGLSSDAWSRFSDSGYKHYSVGTAGFKYNMTDVQAALGVNQIPKLEERSRRRSEIWARYDNAFAKLPIDLPALPSEAGTVHALHLYAIQIDRAKCGKSRDEVMVELHRLGIGTGVHYTALHLHPFYRETYGYKEGMFPNAERIGRCTLSLPMSPKLTDGEVERVIQAITKVIGTR